MEFGLCVASTEADTNTFVSRSRWRRFPTISWEVHMRVVLVVLLGLFWALPLQGYAASMYLVSVRGGDPNLPWNPMQLQDRDCFSGEVLASPRLLVNEPGAAAESFARAALGNSGVSTATILGTGGASASASGGNS